MKVQLLQDALGEKGLVSQAADLPAYAVEGRTPQAVAKPASAEEVAQVLKIANERGWSVAPLGGGTALNLGAPPSGLDLVLSTERLNRIIDIDTANLTVTVQAGVKLGDLQALLAGQENRCFFPVDSGLKSQADFLCSDRDYKGVFLPLDPPGGGRASLGGILAANDSGPWRHRYGQARDLVLGLRFVQPDGGIIGLGGKTVKNVSGYDQGKLLIGSLGGLGVITEATLRLLPLPPATAGFKVEFSNREQATAFVQAVQASKLLPSSLELISSPDFQTWTAALLLEGTAEEIERQLHDLAALAGEAGAKTTERLDEDQARTLTAELAAGPQAAVRLRGFFPLAAFEELLAAWQAALAASGLKAVTQARPGLGLAWAILDEPEIQAVRDLTDQLRKSAIKAGGGLVVENAPPEMKSGLDIWGPPGDDWPIMAALKKRFDPHNILNPGRFVGGL